MHCVFFSLQSCWAPEGRRPVLSEVPQIRAIFADGKAQLATLAKFNDAVEKQLNVYLIKNEIPPVALQQVCLFFILSDLLSSFFIKMFFVLPHCSCSLVCFSSFTILTHNHRSQ